jgi:predicted Zn-dependent protease
MSKLFGVAEELVQAALKEKVEQVEVVFNESHIGVARFKDKAIHQNIEGYRPIAPRYQTYSVRIRIINNERLGVALSSAYDKERLVKEAVKSAKYGPEYKSFTPPVKAPSLSGLYYKDTANLEPDERVESINLIVDYCKDADNYIKSVGGMLLNLVSQTVLVNSLGLEAEHKFTGSQVIVTAVARESGNEGSGYDRQCSRNFYDLNLEKVAMEAAESAITTIGYRKHPVPVGKRTVIFEAEAIAEYLGTLTQRAFSIDRVQRTVQKVPLGELVLDESLTVYDNGRDRRTLLASAIDGEGTPKQNLCLINNGVPENRCYNRDIAENEGKETTGHAANPWSGFFTTGNAGIYTPINQIIEPGNSTLDDLIFDTKEGVLIRRLRGPGPMGGTVVPDIIRMDSLESWNIKNGEIIGPANPIRFTDSLVDTLKDIQIGDSSTVKSIGSFVIPAIKINSLYISQPSVVMYQ